MKSSSSFALAIGFGVLIVLIGVLGVGATRRADTIYGDMRSAQERYSEVESFRRDLSRDMYLADILVRDYLLDPSPQSVLRHRLELVAIRGSLQQRLDQLPALIPEDNNSQMEKLRSEVEAYWESLDPIFEWTPKEKAERSWVFLARKVLPRREAVVRLSREMANLNHENLQRAREKIQNSQDVLHRFLLQMITLALTIGICVALLTTHRVVVLERKHDAQRKEIEETQNNLRRLSNRLVQAQETERGALSRELHDEVGQTMTALGIELGNLEDLKNGDDDAFYRRIQDAKRLNADAMRAVRDLAMGLRPSMLDDIGLEAALQWQGREFSRHTGVPATVEVRGNLTDLTDDQRTCIYRVVQEALTNCARHAKAKKVLVSVAALDDNINVVLKDDGVGFNAKSTLRGGLGLLGIQERVQALDGRVSISSERARGTTIVVQIPARTAA
jgi:signal transduction histidine kinase